MGKKNPVQKPVGRPLSPKGGAVLTPGNPGNRGGAKGRSGRPATTTRLFCREVLADPDVRDGIRRTARDPDAPGYTGVLRLLLAYGLGLPTQRVELRGLVAVAARLEQLSDDELARLARAPDAELQRLLPADQGADDD